MEYNNEKLTKLVEDKSVEKIVFNTWKECRIIRKDKSVKYMSGIFASEDEYKEFAQRLIKQVKKYKKQLDNCKMHEYNKKCAVRRKQNIGLK